MSSTGDHMRSAIPVSELEIFARDLLVSGGFRKAQAIETARILLWADRRGTGSHGVLRIPRYVEMVETGVIDPDAEIETLSVHGSVACLDAHRMPGASAVFRRARLLRAQTERRDGTGIDGVRCGDCGRGTFGSGRRD